MKIVHITTTDYGGAFRAAMNINLCMQQHHLDSTIVVREKTGQEDVKPLICSPAQKLISKTKNLINLICSQGDVVNDVLGTDIWKNQSIRQADVLVFHWVNSFVSYRVMRQALNSHKKIVFVLHDMWLFTGGCHYDQECGHYEQKCENCPLLTGGLKEDLSYRIWKKKKTELFERQHANLTVVGCSQWITECARKSSLLKEQKCICIPNPVDTRIFYAKDRNCLRKQYQIENSKKLILFGAMIPGDRRKGLDLLIEALQYLDPDSYALMIAGTSENLAGMPTGFEVHRMGKVREQKKMAEIYNLADVFVIPSRQENLSNAVTESLACGTPVVAFDIGGMRDMIESGVNGYLAPAFDTADLARGMEVYAGKRTEISLKFSMDMVAQEYEKLIMQKS